MGVRNLNKTCSLLFAALAIFASAVPGNAADFPDKPIRWITPFPPGGGADLVSRVISSELADLWKQPVVVENIPGVGGTLGLAELAQAAPDGYTIAVGQLSNVGVAELVYPEMAYDPIKDLQPISMLFQSPLLLAVRNDLPVTNVQELIDYAKAHPGELNFGSAGNGSANHLATELFMNQAGLEMTHIPYSGSGPSVTALLSGELDVLIISINSIIGQVRGGQVRGLAVSTPERVSSVPDLPTIGETLPGYEAASWYAVFAPVNTPADIVSAIQEKVAEAIKSPTVQERLAGEGGSPISSTPEELAKFVDSEVKKWSDLANSAGLELK